MAQSQYPSAMEEGKPLASQRGDKYILRLPEGMRQHIADVSTINKRSMNAEIIHRLALTFAWEEAEHPATPELLDEIAAAVNHLQGLLRELRMQQVAERHTTSKKKK
jgi:hypothetical protein